MIDDISAAVRFYRCSGSLWQFRDRIPLEIKRFISYKHSVAIEVIDLLSRDYVELPHLKFKEKYHG